MLGLPIINVYGSVPLTRYPGRCTAGVQSKLTCFPSVGVTPGFHVSLTQGLGRAAAALWFTVFGFIFERKQERAELDVFRL